MQHTELELKLKTEKDFISYLRLLKEVKYDYVIFISVCDTAVGQNFPKEAANEFKKCLKLKTNLIDKFRIPYAAVINRGKVLKEIISDSPENPVEIEGKLNDLNFYVLSRGYISQGNIFGGRATIKLDEKVYNSSGRGIYFLIFDPNKDEVIDYCAFDGYDDLKCIKPYEIESDINNFIESNPNVKLVLFNSPAFPSNISNFTDNERFIINENIQQSTVIKNADLIYERELSPLCAECNSLEDFKELISTPKSYVDVDGILKFEYKSGNKVNTLNGIRVTTDQPNSSKRAIFFVGQCTTFCVGADDSHTFESYLQRKLNQEVSDKGFIVFNYGYFLGVIWFNKRHRLIDILNSVPVKPGDIVFLRYDAALPNIPMCDILDIAERPHNYGEIFYAKFHYTSNGYRMIADKIYDFLKSKNFYEDTINTGGGYGSIKIVLTVILLKMKILIQMKKMLLNFTNQI